MKVSNTDIIDTVTDEKKLNLCLIQGWCFQKSLSTVPKRAKITRLNYRARILKKKFWNPCNKLIHPAKV